MSSLTRGFGFVQWQMIHLELKGFQMWRFIRFVVFIASNPDDVWSKKIFHLRDRQNKNILLEFWNLTPIDCKKVTCVLKLTLKELSVLDFWINQRNFIDFTMAFIHDKYVSNQNYTNYLFSMSQTNESINARQVSIPAFYFKHHAHKNK